MGGDNRGVSEGIRDSDDFDMRSGVMFGRLDRCMDLYLHLNLYLDLYLYLHLDLNVHLGLNWRISDCDCDY